MLLSRPQARLTDWAEQNQRIFGPGALAARGLSARPASAAPASTAPVAVYDTQSTELLGVAGSLQWPSTQAPLQADFSKEQRVRQARVPRRAQLACSPQLPSAACR